MKIVSSLVVALAVFTTPGVAQAVKGSDLLGSWVTTSHDSRTGLEAKDTLVMNANGKFTMTRGGQWRVRGDSLLFGQHGMYKFKLQGDGQAFTLYSGADTAAFVTFKRSDAAPASGLTGTWAGKGHGEEFKLVMNTDSTYVWRRAGEGGEWKLSGDTLTRDGIRKYLLKLQNNGQELVWQQLEQHFNPATKQFEGEWMPADTTLYPLHTYTRAKP